jgi:hypothetical protein
VNELIKTVTVGERDFIVGKMNFLESQKMFLRITKRLSPVVGMLDSKTVSAAKNGAKKFNLDMHEFVAALQQVADESIMADVVVPLFEKASVVLTDVGKLNSPGAIDRAFNVDQMADFWELVYRVLDHNFHGFFLQLRDRFGGRLGSLLGSDQAAASTLPESES